MGDGKYHSKGFTIIELVMVLLIAAVLSVVAVTVIMDTGSNVIDLAARKLAYDIGYVRNRAMTSSKPHKIYLNTPDRFSAGFGNYTLITNPDDNTNFDYNLSTRYSGVSFFRNYSAKFDSLGMQKFNGMTSITLTAGTKTKAIKIVPNTGRVYVQ